jgi:hypothetical protein
MFEKRLRGYRAIGYAHDQTPLGDHAHSEELTDNPSAADTPEVGDQAKRRRVSRPGSAPSWKR